jgi:hypothetical protein
VQAKRTDSVHARAQAVHIERRSKHANSVIVGGVRYDPCESWLFSGCPRVREIDIAACDVAEAGGVKGKIALTM